MAHYAPQRVRVCIDADGVLTYRGPYIPALIGGFKSLPFRFRDYAPDDGKLWTIKPPYAEEALTLILRYVPDAQVEYTHQSQTHRTGAAPGAVSDHFATLHLLPTAPPELIGAAYRALAKLTHPDCGGDPAAMRRLTEAHDALSRRLSA
jgi:hypothetical protein